MASLADHLVGSFFGGATVPALEVGLASGGRELPVATAGYARRRLDPGDWEVEGSEAEVTVRFGPFPRGARVDGAVIIVNGELAQALPFGGELALLPGMELSYQLEAEVASLTEA